MYGNVWRTYAYHAVRNRPSVLRLVTRLDGLISFRTLVAVLSFPIGFTMGSLDVTLLSTITYQPDPANVFLVTAAAVIIVGRGLTIKDGGETISLVLGLNTLTRSFGWGILAGAATEAAFIIAKLAS